MIIGGKAVDFAQTTKYLGVILDKKLLWQRQLEARCQNSLITFWQCRRAMGMKWGLGPKQLMWIYSAIVTPRLSHAILVWWPRTELVTAGKLLDRIQGMFLRGITSTRKSTPVAALRAMLGVPPLALTMKNLAMQAMYRLHCGGSLKRWNTEQRRLFRGQPERLRIEPQDRIKPLWLEEQNFKIAIPSREEWEMGRTPKHGKIWYTDGSRTHTKVGAGFCGPKESESYSLRMGDLNTVYQAELLAIYRCAEKLLGLGKTDETFWICTDSQAALRALRSSTVASKLVKDTKEILNRLAIGNKLSLTWIPGHSGWKGNERADRLAREGAYLDGPFDSFAGIPYSGGVQILQNHLREQHTSVWRRKEGCRTAKALLGEEVGLRAKEVLSLSRQGIRTVSEILTGHGNLMKFKHTIGKSDTPFCMRCEGEEEESSTHFLCECPALIGARRKWLGPEVITVDDVRDLSVGQILGFCHEVEYSGTH